MFEGLTTGLLRITAVIFRCLISSFPDGNNHSTALKIIQDVKSKSSQVEAFNSRIQDLIRLKKKILKCLYSSFITGKENYFNLRKIQTFLTLNVREVVCMSSQKTTEVLYNIYIIRKVLQEQSRRTENKMPCNFALSSTHTEVEIYFCIYLSLD